MAQKYGNEGWKDGEKRRLRGVFVGLNLAYETTSHFTCFVSFPQHLNDNYMTTSEAAQQIGIDSHIMSRITGSVFVEKSW